MAKQDYTKSRCYIDGRSNHKNYAIYISMIARCYNKDCKQYKNYGWRGIRICDSWLNDFWEFVKDMGEKPYKMTLDRIDNDGNYCPSNCKWSTQKEQANNTRTTSKTSARNRYRRLFPQVKFK